MRTFYKFIVCLFVLFTSAKHYGQNHSKMNVDVNMQAKTLTVEQELVFVNQSEDTLTSIVFNDWNNAYSSKTSPLARRFSDEFYRGFHLAKDQERGSTKNLIITSSEKLVYFWERSEQNPDFIVVRLREKLAPNQQITLHLSYVEKIPSEKFTKYGYTNTGGMNLKNWFLLPARYENHAFVKNSNYNLDDIANAYSDFDIRLKVPQNIEVTSDLNSIKTVQNDVFSIYQLTGNNRIDFSLFLEPKSSFLSFKNSSVEVVTNFKSNKIDDIQKAVVIDRVVNFTNNWIGKYPFEKITVSETDYERNPFYGLNQLPSFISPFSDEFIFELKFLKTYLNNYLKTTLRLDPRKDNWIYDGIQVYVMMKYIEEHHPESKMLGSLSELRLLKSYNLVNVGFNEQYSYFYMLMARKNLDQPLGNSKESLIKFNEQIASKYRAGLSFKYLSNYLEDNAVNKSIHQFFDKNKVNQVDRNDFENILKSNTNKDISWFFKTIIDSRDLIDFKISKVSKTKESVSFSIKDKTGAPVPVPVYGIKKGQVVFKKWLETTKKDSVFTLDRKEADKIVLNYENEVPEYNLRNNWKKLDGFFPNNRPIKLALMKDLEDPYYNQILYVPTLIYNLYDGFSLGMVFLNKTILDKPFTFEVNPSYSTNSRSFSGFGNFAISQNYRNSKLYNIRYSVNSSFFHYAPDASYTKINPMVQLRIREDDFRENRKQMILFRQVFVNREKSKFVKDNSDPNYSVFDAKYINTRTEVINHVNFVSDLQLSSKFGKVSAQMEYRKLFENNHQINLRLYTGSFLYNTTNSDFFSFAIDRPTDYLFDYDYLGRSESTGIFSQQFILAEGGFKSKLKTPYANQWISSFNASYSVWNWIDVYGDLALMKIKNQNANFAYDSGIRLNLVTDYFELYLPVYSNNGWEISQNKYAEKIRFIITFSPNTLTNLFTRKWF